MKINFKSKKTWIIITAILVAIILGIVITVIAIKSTNSKNEKNKVTENPVLRDYKLKIKTIDEKLSRVNIELSKVKLEYVNDNITKDNLFGMDDYFTAMNIEKVEAQLFNFINEDIYLVKILPMADLLPVETFYYKDNKFLALDIESQGSGSITRYYIDNEKVIAEKILKHFEEEKTGETIYYIEPLSFNEVANMIKIALANYNHTKENTNSVNENDALVLAKKSTLGINTNVVFSKMEMIANKEYYVFEELSNAEPSPIISHIICVEKETGKVMYKDTSEEGDPLITKEEFIAKNETIALKIYYPNNDGTVTLVRDFAVNKIQYNKNIEVELTNAMNIALNLGINAIKIMGDKSIVDISKISSKNKFDNGSTGGIMATESLTKTIFANTNVNSIKVTVDGVEKLEGNHFSFVNDFIKEK